MERNLILTMTNTQNLSLEAVDFQEANIEEELNDQADLTKRLCDLPQFEEYLKLTPNGKIELNLVRIEEFIAKKYKLKVCGNGSELFMYNGMCYESRPTEFLNNICQYELGGYREHFKPAHVKHLIHFAIGDVLLKDKEINEDQLNYLTLQNGLYKMDEGILIPHTPGIFTMNVLPYDYDPSAQCPKFLQFLNEIFLEDQGKINFIQEAVGYIFHKSMPTPSIFFLVGDGSNGKSVLINTIVNLVGKNNTSNLSFDHLFQEYYIRELFQKMVNISGESSQSKQKNTSVIKAVTAGDWIIGRSPYEKPLKFRPYAKHFLAMNKAPIITDTSHGMWRRIWLIEFPKVFTESEMDRDLEQKLCTELSGICNWSLEGYRRLRENNFRFTESESMIQAKKDYRYGMDSVRAFADEHLVKTDDPNTEMKLSTLYDKYMFFCQNEWMNCESKIQFKRTLTGLGYRIENSTRHSNQLYVLKVKLATS